MQKRLWILVSCLLLLALPVSAQNDFGLDSDVTLEPFVAAQFGIQGLRPAEWNPANAPGIYVRQRDPLDATAIIIQAGNVPQEDFLSRLQEQFGLEETPDVVETIESDFFTWDIYRLERTQGQATLEIDIALGTLDDLTALVMLQTSAIFYEDLHAEVFEPIVTSVTPIQLYQDPEERFAVPVPPTWTLTEADGYGVMSSADGEVTVYVAAVETDDEIAAMVDLWQMIDSDYAAEYLENDVRQPENIGILDKVVIVDFIPEDALFGARQGVARTLNGISYLILLDGTGSAIMDNDASLAIIDSNFAIADVVNAPAQEAKEEAESGD